MFAMRKPEGKRVSDIFPALFEDDENTDSDYMTDEEKELLQKIMSNYTFE